MQEVTVHKRNISLNTLVTTEETEIHLSDGVVFSENPTKLTEVDETMLDLLCKKVGSKDKVMTYIPCQNGSLALVTKNEHEQILCVNFICRSHTDSPYPFSMLTYKEPESPGYKSLSVCANDNYLLIASNLYYDYGSIILVFDYNGQCIQLMALPVKLPDNNAICLADSSGSFFVAGNRPFTVWLLKIDSSMNNYSLDHIIQREDLGLGCDYELQCSGISSNAHKTEDNIATALCIAIGDEEQPIHSLSLFLINSLLYRPKQTSGTASVI